MGGHKHGSSVQLASLALMRSETPDTTNRVPKSLTRKHHGSNDESQQYVPCFYGHMYTRSKQYQT